MRDIKLNSVWRRIGYALTWIGLIGCMMPVAWIVAAALYASERDVKREKGLLNKSYQKFILFFGAIIWIFWIVAFLIGFFEAAGAA